ncbi:MAG: hypothetical protein J1D88_03535 [Treponema sp.]|nr:hypothetical protein [Treponema sp.]
MKKTQAITAAAAAVMAGALLAGCASTSAAVRVTDTGLNVEVSAPKAKDDDVDKVVIVDWSGRTLDEPAVPEWLKTLRQGNATEIKRKYSIDANRVIKTSPGEGATREIAQALSRTNFIYTQAAELAMKAIARVGQGLNDMGQLEALGDVASQTKVDMTGLREEGEPLVHWQKVRTTNAVTKETSERYLYWTVFSMSKESWDNLCRKYLTDVMKDVSLTSETRQRVVKLFDEMAADSDKEDAQKREQDEREYKVQMARLEAFRAEANASAAASNAETAQAGLRARELSAEDAAAKRAAEEAEELARLFM